MSDDLVKRLRGSCYLAFDDGTNDYASASEAATRIEELETENAKLRTELCKFACQNTYDMNDMIALGMVRDQQADRIKELEAKLAKALVALHEIAGKKDFADDPWSIARTTIAELKGELK